MKVLVNALSARRGGIVTYTRNLLAALEARGVDATVAVPTDFEAEPGQSTFRLNVADYAPPRRLLWEQTTWRRIVRRINPDILFSSANFGLLNSPVRQVLLLREGGLFDPFYLANMTPQQGVAYALNRNLRRRMMLISARRADHIMTPTEAMRNMVARWLPEVTGKCTVNPYGTLSDVFTPGARRRAWREDGTLRLLYVSVYYPHKLPGQVCKAVDRLIAAGIPAHATVTMSPDEFRQMRGGALDEVIVGDARARGIVTLGHFDYAALPDLYRTHDVFVFPSISETFGHPMAEAMSCGLPVIAADTTVNREICADTALFFEPFSVSGMIALLRRLDAEPDLRGRMAEAGRKRVLGLYGWDNHIDRLIETFERLIHGSQA